MTTENRTPSPVEMNELFQRLQYIIPAIMLVFGLIVAAVVSFFVFTESGEILFAVGAFLGLLLLESVSIAVVWRSLEKKLADISNRVLEHAGGGAAGRGAAVAPLEVEAIRHRDAAPTDHRIVDTADSIGAAIRWFLIIGAILLLFAVPFGMAVIIEGDATGAWVVGIFFSIIILLGLVAAVRRLRILSSFHPGEIRLSRWPIRLNEPIEIHFVRRLRKFFPIREATATLRCVESATYSQGTKRVTAKEVVREIALPLPVSVTPGHPAVSGAWRVTIPEGAPASFAGSNNRIEWRLEVMIRPEAGVEDDAAFALQVAPEVVS